MYKDVELKLSQYLPIGSYWLFGGRVSPDRLLTAAPGTQRSSPRLTGAQISTSASFSKKLGDIFIVSRRQNTVISREINFETIVAFSQRALFLP